MSEELPEVIKTKEFALTREKYFQTLVRQYLGIVRLLPVVSNVILLLIIVPWVTHLIIKISLESAWIVFVVVLAGCGLYGLYLLWRLRRYVYSPENRNFFDSRRYEIDGDFVTSYFADGSFGKIRLDRYIKAVRTPDYFKLYASQTAFDYLPFDAFYTGEDIERLEALLVAHGVTVKSSEAVEKIGK